MKANKQSIKLDELEESYLSQFGYQLRPETYTCGENSLVSLLGELNIHCGRILACFSKKVFID